MNLELSFSPFTPSEAVNKMEPETDKLHPNWRALASVPFNRKIFVKGTSEVFEAEAKAKKSKELQISQEKGCEARNFYESVLNEPSTSKKQVAQQPFPTNIQDKSTNYKNLNSACVNDKINDKTQLQVRKADLFKAVEQDNLEFVKEALEIQHLWKNLRDSYGWSLLMISSKAGAVGVTQHLIDLNADRLVF